MKRSHAATDRGGHQILNIALWQGGNPGDLAVGEVPWARDRAHDDHSRGGSRCRRGASRGREGEPEGQPEYLVAFRQTL